MIATRFTLAAALVVLAHLIFPNGAAAQAVREGPSFAAAGGWGTVRLPDVAYGAGHSDGGATKLHGSFTLGSLGMASYGWGM